MIRHTLDYNQLYSLVLDYNPATHQLSVTFDDADEVPSRFRDAVLDQLQLTSGNVREKNSDAIRPFRVGDGVTFGPVSREFTLRLGKEPIGAYNVGVTGNLAETFHRQLNVDETRRIGTFHKCEPYPMRRDGLTIEENNELIDVAKKSVFTDFHTHSSGQISATGLLQVAMQKKPYYYPISLMHDAGIPTSYVDIPKSHRRDIKRVPFPPLEKAGEKYPEMVEAADLHYIAEQDQLKGTNNLQKLIAHMSLPADHQSTFTDLEYRGNRFRYPLSKDNSIAVAIRMREAEEFVNQGISFALTSFVGIDKPDTLQALHSVVEDLKNDLHTSGFSQRFMIGIPRGQTLPDMEYMLEKSKILLDSPYVMGVDMLGYEADKTKNFVHLLDEYAQWAEVNKPGSFIRVHAGENDKNHDNVKDFLKLAVKYPHLRFLVGHGVYGMDDETIKLLKKLGDRVTVELNPASNIALNNADDVKQLPFKKLLENKIPFIVGSDSAGMYQTDALQLGLSAYHAGLDMQGFKTLEAHQERLVAHMQEYSAGIAASIPNWETEKGKAGHLRSMGERIAAVAKPPAQAAVTVDEATIEAKLRSDAVTLIEEKKRPPELQGKFPVTIIGASGTSWKNLDKGQQRENAIAIDMLIHALGDNCYIVQGRNKKVGLSKVINQALQATNEERKAEGKPAIFSVGLHVNPTFDDTHSYRHLTHMIRIHGSPLDLANSIVDHTFDNDGALLAVGGAAYTRDTILEADRRGIHDKHPDNRKMMLLLANTEGASAEKANVLHPDYKAVDGLQLVKKLFDQRPDLFPAHFNKRQLNDMYRDSKKRVDTYGYNMVDSGNTVVSGPIERIPTRHQKQGKQP